MSDELIRKLLGWGGVSTTPNGVRQVLHMPEVAELVYLHTIFPPISPKGLAEITAFFGGWLHKDYLALMKCASGLHMFAGQLSVYGYRQNLNRDPYRPEPFSVMDPTGYLGKDPVILRSVSVAFYDSDGSTLWLHGETGRVTRRQRGNFAEIGTGWASLPIALMAEHDRLAADFEKAGRKMRPIGG
jgi:hypothetical protein